MMSMLTYKRHWRVSEKCQLISLKVSFHFFVFFFVVVLLPLGTCGKMNKFYTSLPYGILNADISWNWINISSNVLSSMCVCLCVYIYIHSIGKFHWIIWTGFVCLFSTGSVHILSGVGIKRREKIPAYILFCSESFRQLTQYHP